MDKVKHLKTAHDSVSQQKSDLSRQISEMKTAMVLLGKERDEAEATLKGVKAAQESTQSSLKKVNKEVDDLQALVTRGEKMKRKLEKDHQKWLGKNDALNEKIIDLKSLHSGFASRLEATMIGLGQIRDSVHESARVFHHGLAFLGAVTALRQPAIVFDEIQQALG